jgi:hypothetical protein
MSTEKYLTIRKFNDIELANEFSRTLNNNNISYILENTSGFDPSFSNNELSKEYAIKIKQSDFERVNDLLIEISQKDLQNVEQDHYLFSFTDDELFEIISRPDEWNQFDYLLAQKILKQRGKEIKPEKVETLKKERLKDLSKPEKSNKTWICLGYIMAFFGGILGIFIGWHLSTHKKTLPNGETVYAHSVSDRKHGFRIVIIGVLFFIFWVTLQLANVD